MDPKFNVTDHIRTWTYKKIFAKGYVLNWSEEHFATTKVKNTVRWTYFISDPKVEEVV